MTTATANPNEASTKKSSDPAAEVLAAADRRLNQEIPVDPVTAADPLPPAAAEPEPPQFLTQTVQQLVNKGLVLSKLAGWKSPAIPGVLSEEEWQASVASTTVIVIQKRWPTLANQTTPEFVLVVLLAPWLAENLLPTLLKVLFSRGKSDRNSGSHRDGKNNVDAEAPRPESTNLSNRPDPRPEV